MESFETEMREWRRHLHQFPELGFAEVETSQFILKKLKEFGVDDTHYGLGKTGVVGTIHGKGFSSAKPGKRVGLRADMDALSLQEKNNFSHKSQNQGVMHACGHDGHMSMLLGATRFLCQNRDFQGTVHVIFQPAEEGLGGAKKMIEEGLFEKFPVEAVFGLHNWPQLPEGHIGVRPGPIMAASDHLEMKVVGKGGHAALPHLAVDPVIVASHLVLALQNIISRVRDPLEPCVLSITQINGGSAFNIIPEAVTLKGSCRAFSDEKRDFLEREIKKVAAGVGETFGAKIEVNYHWGYPPTVNTAPESSLVAKVAKEVVGTEKLHLNLNPSMGAEDFACMLQKRPGCYFWLGTGNPSRGTCQIHHPQYDFNDEVLSLGAKMWVEITREFLG